MFISLSININEDSRYIIHSNNKDLFENTIKVSKKCNYKFNNDIYEIEIENKREDYSKIIPIGQHFKLCKESLYRYTIKTIPLEYPLLTFIEMYFPIINKYIKANNVESVNFKLENEIRMNFYNNTTDELFDDLQYKDNFQTFFDIVVIISLMKLIDSDTDPTFYIDLKLLKNINDRIIEKGINIDVIRKINSNNANKLLPTVGRGPIVLSKQKILYDNIFNITTVYPEFNFLNIVYLLLSNLIEEKLINEYLEGK